MKKLPLVVYLVCAIMLALNMFLILFFKPQGIFYFSPIQKSISFLVCFLFFFILKSGPIKGISNQTAINRAGVFSLVAFYLYLIWICLSCIKTNIYESAIVLILIFHIIMTNGLVLVAFPKRLIGTKNAIKDEVIISLIFVVTLLLVSIFRFNQKSYLAIFFASIIGMTIGIILPIVIQKYLRWRRRKAADKKFEKSGDREFMMGL